LKGKPKGVILNFLIFLASIVFSSVGVGFDNLTTRIFVRDLGIEFEWNPRMRMVRERWGYKTWIGIEAIIVAVFGLFDLSLNLLFVGAFWGVGRSLFAAHNFSGISEYRTIGIEAFKEDNRRRMQLFHGVSRVNRYKCRLQYFVGFLFCVITFVLMLLAGAYELVSWLGLFLTVLVWGFILGIGAFFFMAWLAG
jgi:ABC-type multidrug transport system fused ATPase/permease subunit